MTGQLGGLETVGEVGAATTGAASGAFSLLQAANATSATAANIVPFMLCISCSFMGWVTR